MNQNEIEEIVMPLIIELQKLESAAIHERAARFDRKKQSDDNDVKGPAEQEYDAFVGNLMNTVETLVPEKNRDYNLYHYTGVFIIHKSNLRTMTKGDEIALPFYTKGMELWEKDNTVSTKDKARMCKAIAITYQYLIGGKEGITFDDYFSILSKYVDYSEAAYGSDSDEFSEAVFNITFWLNRINYSSEEFKEKFFSWVQKCQGKLAYLVNLEASVFFSKPKSTSENSTDIERALACLRTGEDQLEKVKDYLKPVYYGTSQIRQDYKELKNNFKSQTVLNKARLSSLTGCILEESEDEGTDSNSIDIAGQEKPYDVFISYARKDSDLILKYVEQFENEGLNVWMDKDGIKSGDQFKKVIVSAIKNSKVFVFFSSKAAGVSEWTEKEIGIARMHNVPIIPAKLDDSVYNDSVALDLVNLDFVELFPDNVAQTATSKLIKSIKKRCGIKSIPLVDKCKEHIKNHDESFGYIFRGQPFMVYIQPLHNFVLDFCKSNNSEKELIDNLVGIIKAGKEQIEGHLRRYEPTMEDILTQSGPRFALIIDGYAVKVCNVSGFNNDSVLLTKKLDAQCSEYHLLRKKCTDAIEELIENPSVLKENTRKQKEIDDYVEYYLKSFEHAWEIGGYRIHFKPNKKFNSDPDKVYYIGFSDMYRDRFRIRVGKDYESYDDDNDPVLAEYPSAEATLRDGWELD